MAAVSLLNVEVKNNPASFSDPYEFEITFEALEPLQKDIEWKVIYVGSATSSEHDQVLDTLLVGPVPLGVNKFPFEADPPDLKKIPNTEIIGVTVILLSGSYDDREFVRVGYYVNNEYTDEALQLDPPAKPVIEKVRRNILAEKPRVTRFAIKWDSEESAPAEYPPEQEDVDAAEDDEAAYGAEEDDEEEELETGEDAKAEGEDAAMGGMQEEALATAHSTKAEDEASEAGSEDLEAESEGSDDEGEEDEEEGEGEGEGEGEVEGEANDDMDTTEDGDKTTESKPHDSMMEKQHQPQKVMAH